MRSILLCMVFTTTSLAVHAQTDPMNIFRIDALQLNYTEFDSITVYNDTAAGTPVESSAKYLLQNRRYILEGKVNFIANTVFYTSEQTPQAFIVYETHATHGNDTLGAYFIYRNKQGRDSAIVQNTVTNGVYSPIYAHHYYFDNQGLIDSVNTFFFPTPTSPVRQIKDIYYRSGSRIDSMYSYFFTPIPSGKPFKYIYDYDNNGKLLQINRLSDIGPGYEPFSKTVMYHNSQGEIIREELYMKMQPTDPFTIAQVVEYSKSQTFDIPENKLDRLSVFPNPAKDIIQLAGYNALQKLDYEVYGLSGKLIKEGHLEQQSLDISTFKKGIYILKISGDGFAPQSFRLLKN